MDHWGQKEAEKKMRTLKFTAFPEVCGIDPGQQTMLIFSDKCLFNTDGLFSRKKRRVVDSLSCDRGQSTVKCRLGAPACGRLSPADCEDETPDLGA